MANIHTPFGPFGTVLSNCPISWNPFGSKKLRAMLPIRKSYGFEATS
jgi:hypothetical protein